MPHAEAASLSAPRTSNLARANALLVVRRLRKKVETTLPRDAMRGSGGSSRGRGRGRGGGRGSSGYRRSSRPPLGGGAAGDPGYGKGFRQRRSDERQPLAQHGVKRVREAGRGGALVRVRLRQPPRNLLPLSLFPRRPGQAPEAQRRKRERQRAHAAAGCVREAPPDRIRPRLRRLPSARLAARAADDETPLSVPYELLRDDA